MSLKKILESDESIEKKEQQIDSYYQSELITRVEACELLDVSTKSLDRYIKQNKLSFQLNSLLIPHFCLIVLLMPLAIL
ncbi:hypothetical protein EG888_09515 [Listeria monocytogenes]|jgi:hypothetical protein|uniref:Uncharacterized protein n=2 Tax=Listeria monocytogenes TaxID=1639 RepID=A0A9Q7MTT1_LISMN|nr:hypothetical protein [Listeria monocytogenes]NP_463994.1 hypothetical protein lmo0465 [Listeria monocytogenes EGD-e]EAD5034971.1 hypothetical protein [Listeria monocytogenes serotype 1/2a]EAE3702299.1 hypothetical protein [Listeria monocytogenes serotype 1/2c]AEO24763.1 conserved hypothetical protein [Listeria monocytogenes FSL R2-561]ANE38333.1 hypothetical protein AAV53_03765 [Listeria monocytogenes]ASH46084.1 hypothetical protein A440_0468 [Listeria monocytogenes serotype 1/2c str. 10-5